MLERGSSGTEAFWGSMAVGTVNMLIYEYGVGELMKLSGPADTSTLTGMLDGALKRAGVTATAGATNEMSKILIDTVAMGNSSEFSLEMKRLRTEGMSAEEAWRQTFTDYVERVVDTGVRSGRYGLIAGLSEYGGEYFRQHPEAFNALVSGKTGWSGGMRGVQPGGAQGLLELPGATLAPGGRMEGMPMLPGPAAVKDDWETAIEEAVEEWKGSGAGRPEEPEGIDISGENGIIIGRGAGETNGWFALPDPTAEGSISVEGAEDVGQYTGSLSKVAKPDAAADALADRIGGQSRVRFSNDPMSREFDVVSSEYIGQTKPALQSLNKNVRDQMKATFEAAKGTGRKVYYHFDGQPAKAVIDKLLEYSKRYGVEVIIDTNPLKK